MIIFPDFDVNHFGRNAAYTSPFEQVMEYPESALRYDLQARRNAAARQRQRDIMRRRAYEEEIVRRKIEEQYRRRSAARQLFDEKELDGNEEPSPLAVVRGWDGQLYRVPVEEGYRLVQGRDGRLYRVREPVKIFDDGVQNQSSRHPSENAARTANQVEKIHDDSDTNQTLEGLSNKKLEETLDKVKINGSAMKKGISIVSPRRGLQSVDIKNPPASPTKRVASREPAKKSSAVKVEDASDDENDRECSIWRNRRPGPHESWMEPIVLDSK